MATKIATNVKTPKLPAYRQRRGYNQAIVTLTDALTQKRRDYWLGEFGSPASHEMYCRVLAEWESRGRRLPPTSLFANGNAEEDKPTTLNELALAYWKHASSYYSPAAAGHIKIVLRLTRKLFGHSPARNFGPSDLRLVREAMIKGDANADPPRKPWSRCYVNSQVHRLCRIFKWGAAHDMVPVDVYHRLKSVEALRRGRSEARETDAVTPVAIEAVNAVKPFLNRQVKALVELQLLTGARGGELFKLRPIDLQIDGGEGVWTVNLANHKTAHLGRTRMLYLGPKAQGIIKPFLSIRPLDAYLFSPAEAEQERREALSRRRKTPLSCGNRPGMNRVSEARKKPGTHYTASSYRRAIERACDRAGVARWHPHQLRHSAATIIRREFGLEAARVALGHSSALVTDAVYAERDMQKAAEIMREIG